MAFREDDLVQQTTAEYLRDELGWESVYAYNDETFGPEGTLGRRDDREVVLTRYLGEALVKLNPDLPQAAYQDAIRHIVEHSLSQSPLQINQEKYDLLKDGVHCVCSTSTSRGITISWLCASCGCAVRSTVGGQIWWVS